MRPSLTSLLFLLLLINTSSHAAEYKTRVAVVELFTSEGCSSCPSADALLVELSKRKLEPDSEIICLGHHVDYWDRLGWKDTYSAKAATTRQKYYAKVFDSSRIYTPQMVVQGQLEFVGSDKLKADAGIKSVLDSKTSIQLKLDKPALSASQLHISGTVSEVHSDCQILAFLTQKTGTSEIKKGENAGRKLNHVDMVRSYGTADITKNAFTNLTLELPRDIIHSELNLVVIYQHQLTGKILAALKTSIP